MIATRKERALGGECADASRESARALYQGNIELDKNLKFHVKEAYSGFYEANLGHGIPRKL